MRARGIFPEAPQNEPPGPITSRSVRFPRGAWWLVGASIFLIAFSIVSHIVLVRNPNLSGNWHTLWWLFDANRENNIPTWHNSLLWAILAVLGILGATLTSRTWSWSILALVAGLASLDEFAQVHERLDVVGNEIAASLGIDLTFTWVLAAIPIVILLAVMLVPLMLALPRPQVFVILAGGAIFLTGALGIETISGMVLAHFGGPEFTFVLVTAIEELFEMVGISVAIGGVAGLYEWNRSDGRLDIRFRGWHADAVETR